MLFAQLDPNMTLGTMWPDDPEFAAIIHPHWRNFLPPDPLYNYLIGAMIGIICLTAVAGNILVLSMFTIAKSLRSPANLLIVNLAVADCFCAAINGFPLKTISAFNQRWSWGKLTCELYAFSGGVLGFASLSTMVAIALDRYFVIVQPIQALAQMTYTRAIVMIVIVWFWSCLWSLPPLLGIGRYIPEGYQTSCTFDYLSRDLENLLFNAGMYIFGFTIPVLIIVYCYYKIVQTVRQNERQLKKMAQKLNSENPTSMKSGDKKADVEAAKTSVILVGFFLMSWTPYALVSFMAMIGQLPAMTPFMAELPVFFAKAATVYNPFVYALRHPKLRVELEKRVPFLLCCCPPQPKAGKPSQPATVSNVNLTVTEAAENQPE